MSAAPTEITADEYRQRIVDLLGGGGRLRYPPRRQRDRWMLLHALGRGFRSGRVTDQSAVDATLSDWLEFIAPSLDADVAALRRALVDEGFLDREPDGSRYWPSRAHERRVRFTPDCDAVDVEVVLADAAEVAERKRREHVPDGRS